MHQTPARSWSGERNPRPSHHRRVDVVLSYLTRISLEDEWNIPAAAVGVLEVADWDPAVLRRARARIRRHAHEPAGRFAERALATLDLALARQTWP